MRKTGALFGARAAAPAKREFFVDNLLVRIHSIIQMILVDRPWAMEVEFSFQGSLIPTFLVSRTSTLWGADRRAAVRVVGAGFRDSERASERAREKEGAGSGTGAIGVVENYSVCSTLPI